MMKKANPRRSSAGSDYARYLGIGFALVLVLAILAAIGLLVDYALGTLPLFLLLGLALGFLTGLGHVYLMLKKLG